MISLKNIALLFLKIVRWFLGSLFLVLSLMLFLFAFVMATFGKVNVYTPIEVQGQVFDVRGQPSQEKTVAVQFKPKKLAWKEVGGPDAKDKHAIAEVTSEDLDPVKAVILTRADVHKGDRVALLYNIYPPKNLRLGSLREHQKDGNILILMTACFAFGFLVLAHIFLYPHFSIWKLPTAPPRSAAPGACSGSPE